MSRTTGLLGVIAGVGVGVKLRWNVGRGCPAGGRRDEVLGLDLSERMLVVAIVKAAAARVAVQFPQGDAGLPPFERSSFDVGFRAPPPVGVRALDATLARWTRLLRAGGILVLVEGHWYTGGGITAARRPGPPTFSRERGA
jgi:SAM-dependent methyltransferase